MKSSMAKRGAGSAAAKSVSGGEEEFRKLPFDDKRSCLGGLLAREKLPLILGDREGRELTRAMQPHELYWLFKESSGSEAIELLGLATPEQLVVF